MYIGCGCLVIMAILLCCQYIPKPQILCSTPPNGSSPSFSSRPDIKSHNISTTNNSSTPKIQDTKLLELRQDKKKRKQGKQLSVLEVERALGAGIFRDRDTNGESDQSNTLVDNMLANSVGRSEGSVEKKLRETGEWLIEQTEGTSRSAGKKILMAVFLWVLPMWIIAFSVAVGIIQLPFSNPFLEDILS